MSKPRLTDQDFCRASKRLRCEVAAIKAVASVESAGNGFYDDGFPVILFERHLFKKHTNGRFTSKYPEISGPAGNYGAAGANQRRKFNLAFSLDSEAAMKSCSWGKFQILGENYRVCGFRSVGEFVDAMKDSEGRQLDAFVSFVIGNHLDQQLREHDWKAFARGYNGPGYRKNAYDTKMATAYKRFAKEDIDCSNISAAVASMPEQKASPSNDAQKDSSILTPDQTGTQAGQSDSTQTQPPTEITKTVETQTDAGKETVEITGKNEQDVNTPAKVTVSNPYRGKGFFSVLKTDFIAVGGGNLSFQGLQEYATQASGWPPWVVSLIVKAATLAALFGLGWMIFRAVHYGIWAIRDHKRMRVEAEVNADPKMKDIEWQ